MSSLTLNVNGKNIDVITVEDLGDRQRVFVGDIDSEIILRSTVGLKIQIGSKIIDTGILLDETGTTAALPSSTISIGNIESSLSSYIKDLVDGQLIYDPVKKSLYLYSGGVLIKITEPSGVGSYLSYVDEQRIPPDNKVILLKNAGLLVDSPLLLSDIAPSMSYPGMSVYVLSERMEYCLDSDNPTILSNWKPTYLSALVGGSVSGNVFISGSENNVRKTSFHVDGYQDSTIYDKSNFFNAISIGDKNLSKGIAMWASPNGNGYVELLDNSLYSSLSFVTRNGEDVNYPLTISGKKVGINAVTEEKFDTSIGGRTVFNSKVYLRDNVSSELFAPGFSGYGMRLGKDDYGYWSLDVDNLTVRQRMNIYELVVNQIRATNGSIWVSDGAKIKTAIKVAEMPVYTKALYSGFYKKNPDNSFSEIPIEERPSYADVVDPTDASMSFKPFKMGFKYGDKYLRIINNLATYVYPSYDTYQYDSASNSYSLIQGTHIKNASGEFVEDPNGDYILRDTVGIYAVVFDDIPPFFEGDLIRMQSWDPKLNALRFARCQSGIQRKISNTGSGTETIIYVFENDNLLDGLSLVRIGNNKEIIMSEFFIPGGTITREKTSGLAIPGAVWSRDVSIIDGEPNRLGAIYLTAADSGAPYIDIIDQVKSHNAFNPSSGGDSGDNKFGIMQTRLKARFGKLKNLVDLDMGLDGGSWQDYLYGIYTDSIFLRGNIVAQAGKIGDMFLKGGVLFTYNDGNIHTPMDFEYENTTNKITASGKINTNWLFNKPEAGVVLDGKMSRFSLGNKLNFENGVLTIDGHINANSGTIGGWNIDDKSIRKDYLTSGIGMVSDYNNTGPIFFSGCTYSDFNLNKESAKFYVDSAGNLKATIGNIAGWTINNESIYKDGLKIIGDPVHGQQITIRTGLWTLNDKALIFAGAEVNSNGDPDFLNAPFSVNEKGYARIKSGDIGGFNIESQLLSASNGSGLDSTIMELNSNSATLRISGVNNKIEAIFGRTNIYGSALYLESGYTEDTASIGLLVGASGNSNKANYGAIGIYSADKIITFEGIYDLHAGDIEILSSGTNIPLSVLSGNKFLIKASADGSLTLPTLSNILTSIKGSNISRFVLRLEFQSKYNSSGRVNVVSDGVWVMKNSNGNTTTSIPLEAGDYLAIDLYYEPFLNEQIAQIITYSTYFDK